MVSAVHAEDSSSASANSSVTIHKTEWATLGICKIYLAEGPSFFIRDVYLAELPADSLVPGACLDETATDCLLTAGRIYLAERLAMDYLARAEHSRFSLSSKLVKKGYSADETARALEYLEQRTFLDDRRFASAWLRNRIIHQKEGRQKLLAGLMSRGISGKDARTALDDFFGITDERELCKKAVEKLVRLGKDGDKLRSALIRKGFSLKLITDCLKS